MRHKLSLAVVLAAAVAACGGPAEVIKTENIPTAGIRFINGVPDSAGSFGLDMRFVDIVEDNAQFRITFRNNPVASGGFTASSQTQYKNARAGARHFVIFLDDTLQNVASTVVKDTTATFDAGKLYTVMLWGNGRSGSGGPAMQLKIWEESVADPGAGNVALRVINVTGSPIDVRQYAQGGVAPATASWANVGALAQSAFTTVPVGQYMFNVQPAGGGTALFADLLAIPGQAPTVDIEGTPGTTQAHSAVTLFVFPRSTAGSKTPQTAAFNVPAGSFMWDRRPPVLTCTGALAGKC